MPVTQEAIDTIAIETKRIATDSKALYDKAQTELAALRSDLDTVKAKSQIDPVFVNKVDTIAESVATLQGVHEGDKAVIAALTKQVGDLEAIGKRPGVAGGWANEEAAKNAKDAFDFHKKRLVAEGKLNATNAISTDDVDVKAYNEYCGAFPHYMRARSDGAMKPNIQAAMSTGSDPDGGYTVTQTFDQRVIKHVFETSNMRALAYVIPISGKELVIPRDEGEFGFGGWVGESTVPSETNTSQLGESKIAVHEMFSEPRVTQQMLEDAGFDVEAYVAGKVGDKFGRIEETAFFTGTGSYQPRGILTYANWTTPGVSQNGAVEQIVSGASAALTGDGLYNLVYSLKTFYTKNANFLLSRTVVRDLLKLKDGQGNYLWQMRNVQAGQPATLIDYEVVRAEDMPVVAANALAVAFGDFKQAYTIVDRLGITLLRDNLTAKPYVKFYNRRRVGGDVVNFESIKLQKIST
jgi:HK97 family phage major capsid protein